MQNRLVFVSSLILLAIAALLFLIGGDSSDEAPLPTARPTDVQMRPSPSPITPTASPTTTVTISPTVTATASLTMTVTAVPIIETSAPELPLPPPTVVLNVPVYGENAVRQYARRGTYTANGHILVLIPGNETLDSFYIDAFEVTNRQFVAYLNAVEDMTWAMHDDVPYVLIDDVWELIDEQLANMPAQGVSVLGARAYCNNRDAVLPHETQWLWAAFLGEDGTPRPYPWGSAEPSRAVTNFDSDSPVPSGQYDEIMRGGYAFDMGGNVAEWVRVDETTFGIIGGSYQDNVESLRHNLRNVQIYALDEPVLEAGFRCVIE